MDSSGLDGLTVVPPGNVLEKEGGDRRKRRGEIQQGRKGEGELELKKERRGICTEGPEPRSSHPEDPCSLAGWLQQRQAEERGKKGQEGGIGREDWD